MQQIVQLGSLMPLSCRQALLRRLNLPRYGHRRTHLRIMVPGNAGSCNTLEVLARLTQRQRQVESVATLGGNFMESKAGAPSVQIHSGTRQNPWRHRLVSMVGGGGRGPSIAIRGGPWWTRCQGWVSLIGRKMRARWVQEAGAGVVP
jgi:hypothetical protein